MAQQEIMTLKKFQDKFNSEQACYDHLFQMRWPDGFCCPKCQNKSYYFLQKRKLYQCVACKHQVSETACAQYLMYKRWKDGFSCPKCQHSNYYYIQTRKLFECSACHYQVSITAGTLLHKTKLPLTTWFWAM